MEVRVEHPEAITRIHARELLDSRGNPTVEVEVIAAVVGAGHWSPRGEHGPA